MKYIGVFLIAIAFVLPHQVHAVRVGNILDPLCLFSWRDGCKDNINIDNSININSNINSPGGIISGNTTTVIMNAPTTYYDPGPVYYPDPTPSQRDPLYVTCYPDDSSVEVDDRVTWSADVYGGTGSYSYDWSGSESLDGNDNEVTIRYDREGNKSATVRVTSGSQTISRSCGTVYVYEDDYYDYNDNYNYDDRLYVSCYPDRYNANVGEYITWRASVSGGNGSYSYTWSGTEGLSARGRDISVAYDYAGRKSASVRVSSRGRTVTRSCSNDVAVGDTYQYNGNTTYLDVTCSANPSVGIPNTAITWTAYPTGGNGAYTYVWSGSDGFSGSQKSVATAYKTNGSKSAVVTVYSAGKSASKACSTNVLITGSTGKKATTIKKPVIAKVETPKSGDTVTDAASKALNGVPWFIVSVLVIIVLFGTVIYLIVTKK